MNIAKPLLTALALASLTLAGCASAPGEVEEQTGTTQQASLTFNSLTFNSLTFNSLTFNSLTFNSLTFNSLTFNSLTFNSLALKALEDPNARDTFSYVVNCALPASETLDLEIQGTAYQFPGGLGLAPEWGQKGGVCDESCKQWVSACVISRLDYTGTRTEISIRGDNPALTVSPSELSSYTNREATYYGDIFESPMKIYACLSPGKTEDPRVCGPSIAGCGVDVLGSCSQLCGAPRPDGSFPDCRVPSAHPGGGHQAYNCDDTYTGSVTVFLQP
jgi:hypothetical protein